MRIRQALSALTLVALAHAPALAAEKLTLSGGSVAIWNLAGQAIIESGTGPDIVVLVERGGRDAAKLKLMTDRMVGGSRLRILYDADRVAYNRPGSRSGSQSTVRLRDDGTWGNQKGWSGRRVTVGSGGRGLEAHANLRVQVPKGVKLELYLAVGDGQQSGTDADILFDGGATSFISEGTRGSLSVDVGSGTVRVSRHVGGLLIDTGSGDIRANDIQGERVSFDTGSGSVSCSAIRCLELIVDTGSGAVRVDGVDSDRLHIDTGSGAVTASLLATKTDVLIDTGSGGVRLTIPHGFGADLRISTGSGGIHTGMPVTVRERSRNSLAGRIGDGRSRVVIDTGSGAVQLTRQP